MVGLLIQEFKTLIKSPASISILIIPLVLLVGLGYLLPAGWIVPSSITIGIVAAVLLYFGGSIEEIKRTSFMKSVSLTRLSKFSFLATKILFAVFVSMISVLWVLLFSWVFTETGLAFLATNFGNLLGSAAQDNKGMAVIAKVPFEVHWDKVQWFKMLYAGMITIVVAVSLSFVFVAFSKSSLSFYLMSFGYLLAMILFGGVVMPGFLISSENSWFKDLYYIVPNYYTNNMMANAFSGGILNSVAVIAPLADLLETIGEGGIYTDIFNNLEGNDQAIELVRIFFEGTNNSELLTVTLNDNLTSISGIWQNGWDGTSSQFESVFGAFQSLGLKNGDVLAIQSNGVEILSVSITDTDVSSTLTYFSGVSQAINDYVDLASNTQDYKYIEQLAMGNISLGHYLELNGVDVNALSNGLFNILNPILNMGINSILNTKVDEILINNLDFDFVLKDIVGSVTGTSGPALTAIMTGVNAVIGKIIDGDSQTLLNIIVIHNEGGPISASWEISVLLGDLLANHIDVALELDLTFLAGPVALLFNHAIRVSGVNSLLGSISPEWQSTILSVATTVKSMFGELHWYDWVMPWVEGILFLAISIKFFKWS